MPEVDRIVLHYAGGETQVFVPETAPPPEPEPDPDVREFDFIVTPDAPSRAFIVEPPWRGFKVDMIFTAGLAKPEFKRFLLFGFVRYGGPKPWINNDMVKYLIGAVPSTWRLRHGMDLDQEHKKTAEGRLRIDPGDRFRILSEVDLLVGRCTAQIFPLQGSGETLRLDLGTLPPEAGIFPVYCQFGEVESEGERLPGNGQGPYWAALYRGTVRILR